MRPAIPPRRLAAPLFLAAALGACAPAGPRTVDGTSLGVPLAGRDAGTFPVAGIDLPVREQQLAGRAQWIGSRTLPDGRRLSILVEEVPGTWLAEMAPDQVLFGTVGLGRTPASQRLYGPLPSDRSAEEALPVVGMRAWVGRFTPRDGRLAGQSCTVRRERDEMIRAHISSYVVACAPDAAASDALAGAATRDVWRRPWRTPT